MDSGVSNLYFNTKALIEVINYTAPKVQVGTAAGGIHSCSGTGQVVLPELPEDFSRIGRIMSVFRPSLIGVNNRVPGEP